MQQHRIIRGKNENEVEIKKFMYCTTRLTGHSHLENPGPRTWHLRRRYQLGTYATVDHYK